MCDEILYISNSKIHGNGVFTKNTLKKGDIVNKSLLFELNGENLNFLKRYHYGYNDGINNNRRFLMLGIPHFLNHFETPNVIIYHDIYFKHIYVESITDIKKGDELLMSYSNNMDFVKNNVTKDKDYLFNKDVLL